MRLLSSSAIAAMLTGAGALAVMLINPDRRANATKQSEAADARPVYMARAIGAVTRDWLSYPGRVEAINKVEVRSQVAGMIVGVHFEDGDFVAKGQKLFTVDPRPFEARLHRAAAQLEMAQARTAYASAYLDRSKSLVGANVASRDSYDSARAAAIASAAQVSTAQAEYDVSALDYEHSTLTAPISGKVSKVGLTEGNLVSGGSDSPILTVIVSVDPVYVDFDLDEASYLHFFDRSIGKRAPIPVTLLLDGEKQYSRTGALEWVDNHLDEATSTIRARAIFANPEGRLTPGLDVKVRIPGSTGRSVTLIEDRAIMVDQDRHYVFTVNRTGHVQNAPVGIGQTEGLYREVTSGIRPGELVVTDGVQSLRDGDLVRSLNSSELPPPVVQ